VFFLLLPSLFFPYFCKASPPRSMSSTPMAIRSDDNASLRHRSRSAARGQKDAIPRLAITDEAECAICFEVVAALGGPVALPCACRASFCHTCWDRALAASITACGYARCPSCRSPMRVDFDIANRCLVFSCATQSSQRRSGAGQSLRTHEDYGRDDWQQRLYEEAKPTQIHLLQQFGGRLPIGQGVVVRPWGPWPRVFSKLYSQSSQSSSSTDSPRSIRSSSSFSSSDTSMSIELDGWLPSQETQDDSEANPRCVCGSSLRHVSVHDRVRAFVHEETPVPPPPHLLERLMANPPIFCDICDRRVGPSHRVWTCENGRRTVLHAAAYDVCEACFAFHVHGESISRTDRRESSHTRRKSGRIGR